MQGIKSGSLSGVAAFVVPRKTRLPTAHGGPTDFSPTVRGVKLEQKAVKMIFSTVRF
jgi:hypothetical protein